MDHNTSSPCPNRIMCNLEYNLKFKAWGSIKVRDKKSEGSPLADDLSLSV
jgi:hypothetical protein